MNTMHRAGLRQDLIRDEGLRLRPYRCTAGKLSIGIGRNLDDVGISHDEALYLCDNDMRSVLSDLHQFVWFMRLDPIQQRAVANMRFQLGAAGFRAFRRMIAALERGDVKTAAAEGLDSKWAAMDTPARARRVMGQLETGRLP